MSDATTMNARDRMLDAAASELDAHGASALSLRAVARAAGVSHALPKYWFGDRAGLLTALAARGYRALATALDAELADEPSPSLARLGRIYVDFGLGHRPLFDLMFRASELHQDDPDLRRAQQESIAALRMAAAPGAADAPPSLLSLMAWTFAHGVVVLARDGALQAPGTSTEEIVDAMLDRFEAMAAPRS